MTSLAVEAAAVLIDARMVSPIMLAIMAICAPSSPFMPADLSKSNHHLPSAFTTAVG
jgi:hypothetical protein